MSATTQVTTFSDLYTDLLNRTHGQTGVTATQNQAKRYINIALFDMHVGFGEKFSWAERSAQLITQAEYTTGTITATKGSATIAGASTAWNTNNDFDVANMRAGGKIVIAGSKEVYEISAVASDISATLTSRFVTDTVTAGSYSYFEDAYDLHADFLRPMDLQSFDTNDEIALVGRNQFRRRYPRNKTPGKPRVATLTDHDFSGDTTPVRKVRFAPPPLAVYLISYAFVTNKLAVDASGTALTQMSADTDEPIVPLPYRHAIIYHALQRWYRDKKDDSRSREAGGDYTDLMLRITGDREIGASRPQIQPRVGPYYSRARRPYRAGRAGRYVTGSAFDELRE